MDLAIHPIPVHLLFSYISVVITAGLMLLALASPRRQATWSFIALAATMALWQAAKLAKNGGVLFLDSQLDWLANVAFAGATFIYPSLFILAIQLSGRRLWRFRWHIAIAMLTALIHVWLYAQGVLDHGQRLEKYGYYTQPTSWYWLYTFNYSLFMFWGMILLWKKPPERFAVPYPSRLLFWASSLGFGFGSLEFYSILVHPLYPLADLSIAIYSAVFFWAIFRFNYLGRRALMRTILLGIIMVVMVFALVFAGMMALQSLSPWFEQSWVLALLLALLLSALLPWIYQAYSILRLRLNPSHQGGRELLLKISSHAVLHGGGKPLAEMILLELKQRFGYPQVALQLVQGEHPIWIGEEFANHYATRISSWPDSIRLSRRQILDEIRQVGMQVAQKRPELLRHWRLMRRLCADVLITTKSDEGLEVVLIANEGRYHTEEWQETAELLGGVCQILADHMRLQRISDARAQEKHLSDLGLMAAGLAHEIKNPLEGIYGAAQLLQEEEKGNAKFINMVLKESVRLNDIVQNFLSFSRPWKVDLQTVQLNQYLEDFAKTCNVLNIPLQVQIAPQIEVFVDSQSLSQILLNLVQNGWRAQQLVANVNAIQIQVVQNKSWLELHVLDQGEGIPETQSTHLFKPFFTTHAQGNGLGLAMSRKMARAMGGDLWYHPTNHATCFILRLKMP